MTCHGQLFFLCATSRCATTRTRSQQQKSRFRNLGKVNYAQRFEVTADSARSLERTFVENSENMLIFMFSDKKWEVDQESQKNDFSCPMTGTAIKPMEY